MQPCTCHQYLKLIHRFHPPQKYRYEDEPVPSYRYFWVGPLVCFLVVGSDYWLLHSHVETSYARWPALRHKWLGPLLVPINGPECVAAYYIDFHNATITPSIFALFQSDAWLRPPHSSCFDLIFRAIFFISSLDRSSATRSTRGADQTLAAACHFVGILMIPCFPPAVWGLDRSSLGVGRIEELHLHLQQH